MRLTRLAIIAAAATLALVPARAADLMPLKAATSSPFDPGARGWYATLGTEAGVAQANVTGTNLFATSIVNGNLKAAGGAVCGGGGYINGNIARWWRVEASACWQNITANNGIGSVASRWSATQEIDIGFDLFARIFNAVGNLGVTFPTFTPSLPSNVLVASAPRQYVGVGLREFGIDGTFGSGTGSTWNVAPMAKTGYIWQTVDTAGRPTGGALDIYAWAAWPMRGVNISNVFAPNGQQLTIGAAANMGTQYGAGLRYMFAL